VGTDCLAISNIAAGSDYQVWNYNVASQNSWSAATPSGSGLKIAVGPDSGWPWVLNHLGAVWMGYPNESWVPVSDVQDAGTALGWTPQAESLAVGPDYQAWIINNQSWDPPSAPDCQIFQLTQYNSTTDAAWVRQPGGAKTVTVSADGTPWIINDESVVFMGAPGWQYGGGLEPEVEGASGGPALHPSRSRGDAGRDAVASSMDATAHDSGSNGHDARATTDR
jgi:hypothetical protein